MTLIDLQMLAEQYRATSTTHAKTVADANRYLADPVLWAHEKAHVETWSKTEQIMCSVRDNHRTAVRSAHGIGKSHVAAQLVVWWLSVHKPGEAFVVTSAPTFSQVKNILWREIGRAHIASGAAGRMLGTEWVMQVNGRDEPVAIGRKPADHNAHGFQGIHARYILVILDEACGITGQLWVAAQALATNTNSRILAIGNPDDPQSEMARICAPESSWNVIGVSAFDTPNLTGEHVTDNLRGLLVDQSFIDAILEICGGDTNHPIYRSKVLGEFTVDSPDSIIPMSLLLRCRTTDHPVVTQADVHDGAPHVLGVDVGGGSDMTVIRERIGRRFGRVWRKRTPDQADVVGMILTAINEVNVTGRLVVNVDDIGLGWGVPSRLNELRREGRHYAHVRGVSVSDAATQPDAYVNLKAEIQWLFRIALQRGEWNTEQLDDRTIADLAAPKYKITGTGKIQVEPKTDTIKRLGRSPDDGDALLLATITVPPSSSIPSRVPVRATAALTKQGW